MHFCSEHSNCRSAKFVNTVFKINTEKRSTKYKNLLFMFMFMLNIVNKSLESLKKVLHEIIVNEYPYLIFEISK